MADTPKIGRRMAGKWLLSGLTGLLVLGGLGAVLAPMYWGTLSIRELLGENRELKASLANLNREDQAGYAKVLEQVVREGKTYTRLKFVETARDDPRRRVLEKEFTVEGDIVHFDALIVRFDRRLVMDGKERALYLWRRVYSESMAPEQGYDIEDPGQEPGRYRDLLARLPLDARRLFWSEIWELANDPGRLSQYGVQGIYGSVNYMRMKPGLIYVFKISPTGQLYPEAVPDM